MKCTDCRPALLAVTIHAALLLGVGSAHAALDTDVNAAVELKEAQGPASGAELASADDTEATSDEDAEMLDGIDVEGNVETDSTEIYADERRATSAVTEALSSEQIARAGDSDAASTLRRVTGLSVVDGKQVFVRGLGDRYASILLNGAQIPSPDPTRRAVPLDLFPAELLDGIVVQKSYAAELPGEFGGGSVQLRTRGVPYGMSTKISAGLGHDFGDGGSLDYRGGGSDWTGFDNGARELPSSIAAVVNGGGVLRPQTPTNPNGVAAADLERMGEDLAAGGYGVNQHGSLPENRNLSGSFGNQFRLGDAAFGVLAAVRYSANNEQIDEQRQRYAVVSGSELVTSSELDVQRSLRNVEFSSFLSLGADLSEAHRLKNTTLLLRSTEDEAALSEGYTEDPNDVSRFYKLEWIENALLANQSAGEHRFGEALDQVLNWQFTLARAERSSPNTREYRYDQVGDNFQFSRRSDSNSTNFAELDDDSADFSASYKYPVLFGESTYLDLVGGVSLLRRDRESGIRRFEFTGVGPLANDPSVINGSTPDQIFTPDRIGSNGFMLRESTRGTDQYRANQDLDSVFVSADLNFGGTYRVSGGLRYESNAQDVETFSLVAGAPSARAEIRTHDLLPSAQFTWMFREDDQIRLSYAESLSRPEFRELSAAPYTDPVLDLETIGNPDLKPTAIQHLDLRYEHYFSYTESLSLALFAKRFSDPVEKIQVPGTGSLLSLANADSADNSGIELDYFRGLGSLHPKLEPFYLGLNYAYIRSEIDLGGVNEIQTNQKRALQGQSPYVVNLQFGYKDVDAKLDATLLFNQAGRRISQVGVFGAPDVYEESTPSLDFNLRKGIAAGWSIGVKARNLLDPEVEFTQGGLDTRNYRRGRELMFSLSWSPTL